MDRLAKYRQIVRTFLMEYSKTKPINDDLEIQVLFDTEHDHYQIVELGWDGHNRIYSCPIHLDIRDGKVWIQRNQTDELIAEELVLMVWHGRILFWGFSLPMQGSLRAMVLLRLLRSPL